LPNHFPKIFGPDENEELDKNGTLEAFRALADEVLTFFLTFSWNCNAESDSETYLIHNFRYIIIVYIHDAGERVYEG
jgi:hypothetical protein